MLVLAVVRDLIVNRRIHSIYLYGLPAFILTQGWVMYTITHHSAWWLTAARFILA